jgi:hypothetical protein
MWTVRSIEVPWNLDVQLLYWPQYNTYMDCELTGHPQQFNIKLQWAHRRFSGVQNWKSIQSPNSYIHVLWAHWITSRVQYWTSTCSLKTLRSSILNSYTIRYPIYACPASSLDILQESISNCHKVTKDPLEFNIEFLHSPLSNIYMFCELNGHSPEFNIQLQWAHWTPSTV